MTQQLDLLSEIPCYKCIMLEPAKANHENCDPSQCQTLTEWVMKEARSQQEKQAATAAPSTQQ